MLLLLIDAQVPSLHSIPKDESGAPLGTTVAVIRQALQTFDTAMPPGEQNRLLAIGAVGGAAGAEEILPATKQGADATTVPAPVSEYRQVTIEQFMKNLRTTVIHRYSQPPIADVVSQQNVRQLSYEEHAKLSKLFNEMDLDMTGTLTADELKKLIVQVRLCTNILQLFVCRTLIITQCDTGLASYRCFVCSRPSFGARCTSITRTMSR